MALKGYQMLVRHLALRRNTISVCHTTVSSLMCPGVVPWIFFTHLVVFICLFFWLWKDVQLAYSRIFFKLRHYNLMLVLVAHCDVCFFVPVNFIM